MRFLLFVVGVLVLMSGCAASPDAEKPTSSVPTLTAAQEAVLTAPKNPFYTPLVGRYLAAANQDLPRIYPSVTVENDDLINRGLPKKYTHLTVEKVEFINRDLITVFKYPTLASMLGNRNYKGSMYWWELRKICRNPLFLELNRSGIFFYKRTIFVYQGVVHTGSLSPISREGCAQRGF